MNELKTTQFGKMIGANWTIKYIGKNCDIFKGMDLIIFESLEKVDDITGTGTKIRRIDVKARKDGIFTYFEFKSITPPPLPPLGFSDQFIKDLKIGDVASLSQIKWVFDPDKVSNLVKSDFMDVLRNAKADIPTSAAIKLVKDIPMPSVDNLLDLIEANFNEIFIRG